MDTLRITESYSSDKKVPRITPSSAVFGSHGTFNGTHGKGHNEEERCEKEYGQRETVAILGVTQDNENYGVCVLFSSVVEALTAAKPEAGLLVVDYGHESEQWDEKIGDIERKIGLLNLEFNLRLHLPNNVFRLLALAVLSKAIPSKAWRHKFLSRNACLGKILRTSIVYAISGGDSFSDIYGLKRFLYVSLPQILALSIGKRLVLLPQTFGPYTGLTARLAAGWILRRAKAVISRDTQGVETVRQVTGPNGPHVHVFPDVGFCMSTRPLPAPIRERAAELRSRGPIVGLNVSSLLYMGGYKRDNAFRLIEPFPQLVAALVNHIVQNLHAQVLLIPHVRGGLSGVEDETQLCAQLHSEFSRQYGKRVCYLAGDLDHRQTKALIGQCDLFVGARMHACIAALSQCVPAVGLAYSRKFSGVFASVGMAEFAADLRVLTAGHVTELLTRAYNLRPELQVMLGRQIRTVREQLKEMFNLVPA